jgi:hypothetical protein
LREKTKKEGLFVERKSLPKFRFSAQLIRPIKRSSDTLVSLGTLCGLSQPQLSRFSAGQSFT